MSRVTSGVVTHARHKKVIKAAKGYQGRRKSTFKVATQAVDKANQYATRDRKARKRNFRSLWIQRINAGCRAIVYSENPNWNEAQTTLEKALELRGDAASLDSSTHLYLALALINSDGNFLAENPSEPEAAAKIERSLGIARIGRSLTNHPKIEQWAKLNNYHVPVDSD
jgi:ribosomal protein L20